ncbi:MAG TPA: chemotaxis protein CheX [Acidobacteriota bacterium]|nr:chemotaxis protein CheX [Acidobacteriota bacterium]
MKDEESREKIDEIFCDVIEKMAFMFGEPVTGDELPPSGPHFYSTEMSFHGAREGSLIIAVPAAMCAEIAANVLGVDIDSELAESRSCDALKELLNVTCGNILTALAGEEPVFDLHPPTLSEMDEDGWNKFLADGDTLAYNVDENPVLLKFSFKS